MKSKLFHKLNSVFCLIIVFIIVSIAADANDTKKDFYQIKIYHLKNNDQVQQVDEFLKDAYLPALHRRGIKNIGVFKPVSNDTSSLKYIYVLIPFSLASEWTKLDENLAKDAAYVSSAKSFTDASADKAPYDRMESVLLEAFDGQPKMVLPESKNKEKLFELRSYESPTQRLFEKKMGMFNNGEIDIFNHLEFNSVFYGKVISGSRMPNLMYMPVFESMEQKDAHWKSFGDDAKWKEMSSNPENENKVSVSHIDSILMRSTSYSDY